MFQLSILKNKKVLFLKKIFFGLYRQGTSKRWCQPSQFSRRFWFHLQNIKVLLFCKKNFPFSTYNLIILSNVKSKSGRQAKIFCGLHTISELYPTTGVVLIVVLTIMFVCSLPFVRRSGHFEYFYFSHLLYSVYFVAIILHAQHVWKWICVPLGLFLIEKLYLK